MIKVATGDYNKKRRKTIPVLILQRNKLNICRSLKMKIPIPKIFKTPVAMALYAVVLPYIYFTLVHRELPPHIFLVSLLLLHLSASSQKCCHKATQTANNIVLEVGSQTAAAFVALAGTQTDTAGVTEMGCQTEGCGHWDSNTSLNFSEGPSVAWLTVGTFHETEGNPQEEEHFGWSGANAQIDEEEGWATFDDGDGPTQTSGEDWACVWPNSRESGQAGEDWAKFDDDDRSATTDGEDWACVWPDGGEAGPAFEEIGEEREPLESNCQEAEEAAKGIVNPAFEEDASDSLEPSGAESSLYVEKKKRFKKLKKGLNQIGKFFK